MWRPATSLRCRRLRSRRRHSPRVRIPELRRHKDKTHGATCAPVWRSSCFPRTVRPIAGLAGETTAREIARSLQPQRGCFFTGCSALRVCARSARGRPGNPAVVGFAPLDRKFCDARLSTGCALVLAAAALRPFAAISQEISSRHRCDSAARLIWCNRCARRLGRPYGGSSYGSVSVTAATRPRIVGRRRHLASASARRFD